MTQVIINSKLNHVLTIIFNNTSCDPPQTYVWVCATKERYDYDLSQLQQMEHIQILSNGLSPLHK